MLTVQELQRCPGRLGVLLPLTPRNPKSVLAVVHLTGLFPVAWQTLDSYVRKPLPHQDQLAIAGKYGTCNFIPYPFPATGTSATPMRPPVELWQAGGGGYGDCRLRTDGPFAQRVAQPQIYY